MTEGEGSDGAGAPRTRRADWFFDVVSPYSYLQLPLFERLPANLVVRPRPVLFAGLLKHWGQLGPAEIVPKRLHTYRMCVWLAAERGVPFKLPPAHPFNPLKAQRLLAAIGAPLAAVRGAFDLVFAEGRDPNEPSAWRALCERLGVPDGEAIAASQEAKDALRAATDEAIAHGVFGVPTFLIDGEAFWGNESFAMLQAYLRDPGLLKRGEMARAATLPMGVTRKAPA